jgi:tRNA (guanine-N7-)-methyltransferase
VTDFDTTFITRKRKKWKFAHFDSYQNSFSFGKNSDLKQINKDLDGFFVKKQPLVLELAAGNGQFALELAKKYPKKNFIAIDIKSDRLYTSAKKALEQKIENIIFLRTHMNEITRIFEPNSVAEIWLTFPDPYPKKRSAKHRLTHPEFLRSYSLVLQKSGKLKFKTDNSDLFLWSLEQFVAQRWQITELSFDLHESNLPDDYKIKTHYEQKFTSQDVLINFCAVTKTD